jgi:hypothetical protein
MVSNMRSLHSKFGSVNADDSPARQQSGCQPGGEAYSAG